MPKEPNGKCWNVCVYREKLGGGEGKSKGWRYLIIRLVRLFDFIIMDRYITFLKKKKKKEVFIVLFLFPSVLSSHQRLVLNKLLKPLSQTSFKCEVFDLQSESFCWQEKKAPVVWKRAPEGSSARVCFCHNNLQTKVWGKVRRPGESHVARREKGSWIGF